MHHKYHTEGLVVGSLPNTEASKFIFIFTRDFGLVGAHVQGIRKQHSKLRFGLQDFSFSDISLIRGKNGWKVVGAISKNSWFDDFKKNSSKLFICAQIVSFLRKFVRGEEKDEELFNIFCSSMDFLSKEELSYSELQTFLCLVMFKILDRLGYIAKIENLSYTLDNCSWNKESIISLKLQQPIILKAINRAIKESHL